MAYHGTPWHVSLVELRVELRVALGTSPSLAAIVESLTSVDWAACRSSLVEIMWPRQARGVFDISNISKS